MVDNKVPSVNPKHVPITIPIGSGYSTSICPNPEPITFSVILAASLDFCSLPYCYSVLQSKQRNELQCFTKKLEVHLHGTQQESSPQNFLHRPGSLGSEVSLLF